MRARRRRGLRIAASALAVALVVVGCGGGGVGGEAEVRDVISRFDRAIASGDWEAACELFSSEGLARISDQHGGGGCVRFMADRYGDGAEERPPATISKLAISGHHATVVLEGAGVRTLTFEDGAWRLD